MINETCACGATVELDFDEDATYEQETAAIDVFRVNHVCSLRKDPNELLERLRQTVLNAVSTLEATGNSFGYNQEPQGTFLRVAAQQMRDAVKRSE